MHVAHSQFPSYGWLIQREAQLVSVASQAHAALPSGAFLADRGRVKASLSQSTPPDMARKGSLSRQKHRNAFPGQMGWQWTAGWLVGGVCLGGRSPATFRGRGVGGWGGGAAGRKLCVLQYVVAARLCGQVGPLT